MIKSLPQSTERARLRAKADLKAEDVIAGLREIAEDPDATHSARVSAWRNLGLHLGLFEYNAVAEGALAFMKFLAGDQQAVTGSVQVLDSLVTPGRSCRNGLIGC